MDHGGSLTPASERFFRNFLRTERHIGVMLTRSVLVDPNLDDQFFHLGVSHFKFRIARTSAAIEQSGLSRIAHARKEGPAWSTSVVQMGVQFWRSARRRVLGLSYHHL